MTTLSQDRLEWETNSSDTVEYPESDGEPIGETDFHISNILSLRQALRHVLRRTENVYVAANMLFYYEKGNPAGCRAPDVFVVRGVAKQDRRTFKLWVEGKAPSLIIEVTSKKSQVEDLWIKRRLYEKLGVTEYLLFDPLEEYLDPRFQAFELEAGQYVPAVLGEEGGHRSRISGVELRPIGSMLRVIDPESERPVPDLDEAMDAADAASQRAEVEARRADVEARRAQDLEKELRLYRERHGQPDDR
jgi:Uma2 family endonuclease